MNQIQLWDVTEGEILIFNVMTIPNIPTLGLVSALFRQISTGLFHLAQKSKAAKIIKAMKSSRCDRNKNG